MIVFNELSIIGKDLVIDASVDIFEYLKDVEIGGVIVDTDDTFVSTGPSEEPVYSVEFDTVYGSTSTEEDTAEEETTEEDEDTEDETAEDETEDAEDSDDDDDDEDEDDSDSTSSDTTSSETKRNKRVRIRIQASDMGLSKLGDNLFFVYVRAVGIPDITAPCNKDKEYTVGVAVDLRRLYSQGMRHIRELGGCDTPSGFMDWFLRLKAVELAIQTGNYEAAITYWKGLFLGSSTTTSVEDCGCDG